MSLLNRIEIKTAEEIALMRRAGAVVGQTLEILRVSAKPGVSLQELNAIAAESISSRGATPSFLGYGVPPFPAVICTSVNDVIVHGIPDDRVLLDGDLLSIDCGAIVEGWHGDAAITVAVGSISAEHQKLSDVCRESLNAGIAAMVAGAKLTDISHAIESSINAAGNYGILREYTGHGIGTSMHMDPAVPNYGPAGKGPKLSVGNVLALEPMITLGSAQTQVLDDDWSVASADGSWASHWEHTVAITASGPQILTLP
ncbi:MAG: type I methionyl aminopeptidase [Actinomycetes bacterium]|jgi:methionyl aminopeptidase